LTSLTAVDVAASIRWIRSSMSARSVGDAWTRTLLLFVSNPIRTCMFGGPSFGNRWV
jgi:hypothetical protein